MKKMKFDLRPTGTELEYKNMHFATIFHVCVGVWHIGYYYEDSISGKNWYAFSVPEKHFQKYEELVKQLASSMTCFGEDCIYTHGIHSAECITSAIMEGFVPPPSIDDATSPEGVRRYPFA